MDPRIAINRTRWDELAELHMDTYRIDEIDASSTWSLKRFEPSELGDVRGQQICHLQCHLGGDSFALVGLGATVVGVDVSPRSIEIATMRARRVGLADRARFVCASVDEAAELTDGPFDGVYTSWGVLCWLPSIGDWAAAVAKLIKPAGWLYLAETHPYASAIRNPTMPYGGDAATFDASQGDYTSDSAVFEHPESWEWSHGLGEVVTALIDAGMRLRWLHEHPEVPWHLNDQERLQESDGMWRLPGSDRPLAFSLLATRE